MYIYYIICFTSKRLDADVIDDFYRPASSDALKDLRTDHTFKKRLRNLSRSEKRDAPTP